MSKIDLPCGELPDGMERFEADEFTAKMKAEHPEWFEDDNGLMPFCEEALTLLFSKRHANTLRYCELQGNRWFEWDGCRWRRDSKRRVFTLARQLCREQAKLVPSVIENPATAARLSAAVASGRTVAAVVNLARCDPRHATDDDEWDADPWALNTPGGTVDLQTGVLRAHDPRDLHSKITAAAPAAGDCPRWRAFLDQATAGDRALQDYLQRIAGYALTGSVREHALFFFHGGGGNGKGTFLNTLSRLLGDYACVSSMDTFTDSRSERHPTEIAALKGARFVAAQETEANRDWAEKRILALTGGDPISARFMRQDFFTFEPQFKLIIAGNHKPGLKNTNEAVRRRFNLIPFTVTIPPEQRDQHLVDKLKAEWPAILGWAIRGCLDWQQGGLQPPAAVRAATDEYIDDQDAFGAWLAECCQIDANAIEETGRLYAAWRVRADRLNIEPGAEARFRENLQARGFRKVQHPQTRRSAFHGLMLNADGYAEAWANGGGF